jgi:phosphate/sulfate permease
MRERISSLSQREQYLPSWWDEFLWWLATAEKELLAQCVVDRNRYRIIGTTVLATWSFATLAWTYFWSTITSNWFLSVLLGLFMGFIILTIDRALIKGMNKFNKNKIAPLLLRGILAVTLGTFMAQPAILFMFDKEIKLQASLDNEVRKRNKQQELDSLYNPQKQVLLSQRSQLQNQLDVKYSEVVNARQQFVAETDGTGGSGKVGIEKIALAKKAEYEKLDDEYKGLASALQPNIGSIDSNLSDINTIIKKENNVFAGFLNNGFLTRIEALNNLVKKNAALQWRYFLIVIILMLIELMPVLAKTLLPAGTYDEKVRLTEEMEREIAESNQLKEKQLKEMYNQLAKEKDEVFIRHFFTQSEAERNEKMKMRLEKWTANNEESFDGFWNDFKKDMLTKQEN